jgi:hypothetical protein
MKMSNMDSFNFTHIKIFILGLIENFITVIVSDCKFASLKIIIIYYLHL